MLRPGSKPASKRAASSCEVGAQAELRLGTLRIDDVHLDERRREQALDVGHGLDEPRPCVLAERLEEGAGEVVAAPVEVSHLGAPGGRQPRCADAPVVVARDDLDQPGALERPQQPADVPGVQAEPGP